MKIFDFDSVLLNKFRAVQLLLMDCDGVLTDGRLYFTPRGEEIKVFDVRDGQGIVNWHRSGGVSGIISGRASSAAIEARAAELGITHIICESANKAADVERLLRETGIAADAAAFIGDDVGDLPALAAVGLRVAVADAVESVKDGADYITQARGGRGAVREIADILVALRSGTA